MALDPATLPKDVAGLTALLLERMRRGSLPIRAEKAEARSAGLDAEIAHLKLTIAKMKRAEYGASSENGARLIDQLEMQLGELDRDCERGQSGRGHRTSGARC